MSPNPNWRKGSAQGVQDNEKEEQLQSYKTKDRERKSMIRTYEMKVDELKSKLEETERSRGPRQ